MSSSGTTWSLIDRPEFGDDSEGTPATLTVEPPASGNTPSTRRRTIQGLKLSAGGGAFVYTGKSAACTDAKVPASITPIVAIRAKFLIVLSISIPFSHTRASLRDVSVRADRGR